MRKGNELFYTYLCVIENATLFWYKISILL
jgi:hypothetical protein